MIEGLWCTVQRISYFQGAARASNEPLSLEHIHTLIQKSFLQPLVTVYASIDRLQISSTRCSPSRLNPSFAPPRPALKHQGGSIAAKDGNRGERVSSRVLAAGNAGCRQCEEIGGVEWGVAEFEHRRVREGNEARGKQGELLAAEGGVVRRRLV